MTFTKEMYQTSDVSIMPVGSKPKSCSFFSEVCTNGKVTCLPDANFQGPGGGSGAFYTTWSFYAILIATFIVLPVTLLLTKLPGTKEFWKQNKYISTILLGILIGFSANSIGVGVVSQLLVTENKPLVSTKTGKSPLITQDWLTYFNKLNSRVHLVPVLFAILILLLVIRIPCSTLPSVLMCTSIAIPVVFFFIWACVPIPVRTGSKEHTTPFDKAAVVYKSPPFSIEGFLPAAIVIVTVITVYVARGDPTGKV